MSEFNVSQESASQRYNISTRTLRRYNLPFERRGRQIFYRPADIEAAILTRSAIDHNGDQHDAAVRSVARNTAKPPGNLLREVAIMTAARTLVAVETMLGADAETLDWAAEYGIDPNHAAVVLSRAVTLARHAAGHYLADNFDDDFRAETGQTSDEAMSAMTGMSVRSQPAAVDRFVHAPFAPAFQPMADTAVKFLNGRTPKA